MITKRNQGRKNGFTKNKNIESQEAEIKTEEIKSDSKTIKAKKIVIIGTVAAVSVAMLVALIVSFWNSRNYDKGEEKPAETHTLFPYIRDGYWYN